MPQLSDVFDETDPLDDAISEIEFQKYLERLSLLPPWKRAERAEELYGKGIIGADVLQEINAGCRDASLKEFNKKIVDHNKRLEREALCVKCSKWFDKKLSKKENGLIYCPYCWEVCFGIRNAKWLKGRDHE